MQIPSAYLGTIIIVSNIITVPAEHQVFSSKLCDAFNISLQFLQVSCKSHDSPLLQWYISKYHGITISHCFAKTSVLKQRNLINPHHTLSIQQSTQTQILCDSCPAAIRGPKTAKSPHPSLSDHMNPHKSPARADYTAVWIVLDDQMLICVHFKGWQCQKHFCLG